MSCKDCDLCKNSDPTLIKGFGPKTADIMIVNSYAGDIDEDNEQATMSQHLLQSLSNLNIKASEVYYTNAIKCRVPRGTKIKVSEIKRCKKYLDKEIEEIKPKYILLLGSQALKATLDGSITSLNGVTLEKEGIKYLPTFNPSIVYRDPSKAQYVTQALNNFASLVKGKERELPELNVKIVTSKFMIKQAIKELEGSSIAYDIETSGLIRFEEFTRAIGFGNDRVQYILPLEFKFSPLRGKRMAQVKLTRYLVNQLNKKFKKRIAANGKFDDLFLDFEFGVKPHLDFDTMLASHCLDENTPNGLKENSVLHCNALDWDIDKSLKTGIIKNRRDRQNYFTYLGYDIYYTYKLYKVFSKKLRKDKSLSNLFNHVYMPGVRAYEEIEKNGVKVNGRKFKETRKYLIGKLNKVTRRLNKYKKNVNWSSTDQIREFLYIDLKLPILEETDTGNASTGESVLLRLRDKHPAVELLLEYRGIKIQISHFVNGWIDRMYKGRLHPNFKLNGTVTGRTSCNNPNLQQVPRDKKIRSQIVASRPGWSFVEIDLSQAELRIAAIMSGDKEMLNIYKYGGDIHNETYNIIAPDNIEDEKDPSIRKEKRKKAKAVNFGFLYGMGWKKFQEYARDNYGIKLTDKEAKDYRIRFFNKYSGLPKWHDRQRRIVQSQKQVRSLIGRIRRLPDIDSSDRGKKAEAQRQSINSPVQAFASTITILGMIEILGYAREYHKDLVLDKNRFKSGGTVHDAILFEVEDSYLKEFCYKAKHILQSPKVLSSVFKFKSPIPIIADVTVGDSWGNGTELEFDEAGMWKMQIREHIRGKAA